jgi:uncharacterized membrane protein
MSEFALFIAVFLACAVEAVEATTIVLAAGTARDWRSALLGAGGGILLLVVIIGIAGPAISTLPIGALRLAVGGLLLVFGLQWIRKAILRSSGFRALHDEDAIFQEELTAARSAARGGRGAVPDWYAFALSFKGVLLEGLEVAFIVLTFGTIQHRVGLASIAAAAAIVLTAAAGFALRKPLDRVPENSMKFVVGIMLTSFGIFWGAEGAGASWPGADLALLAIIPFVTAVSLTLVAVFRARRREQARPALVAAGASGGAASALIETGLASEPRVEGGAPFLGDDEPIHLVETEDRTFGRRVAAFGAFWYDFIVGDDWRVTVGIVASFALTFGLSRIGANGWWIVPAAVAVLLPFSLSRLTRER